MYLFSQKLPVMHHIEVKCDKVNDLLESIENKFSQLGKTSDSLETFP